MSHYFSLRVKPSLCVLNQRVKQGGAVCSVEPAIIEFFLVIEKQDNFSIYIKPLSGKFFCL
jgi:hypothetical protein